MIKIEDEMFQIPTDFNGIISETPFKLILYFNYDPSINEYDSKRTLENDDYDKSLDIYNNKGENKVLLRRLGFFSFF